jgi:hypothetical protein
MSSKSNHQQRFELIQSGLIIISELEEQIDDRSPRLEEARVQLAQASKEVRSPGFERHFSKSMGMASSVAVDSGNDELAEDALGLGGENS